MNTREVKLNLTPYQLTYLKELVEADYDGKGYAYFGIHKGANTWDKVMLEGLINYFDRKNREALREKIEMQLV